MLSNWPSCVLLPTQGAAWPKRGAIPCLYPTSSPQHSPLLPAGLQYLPSPESLLWLVLQGGEVGGDRGGVRK